MILKDRLICGWKSKNLGPGSKPRIYSRQALKDAVSLFEGESIFLNHEWDVPKGRRKFEHLLGRVTNVHVTEQGMRGDYELSDKHPEAQRIADHYDKKLPLGGMSPDLDAEYAIVDGRQIIVKINKINSLDFVATPATGNIMESEETVLTPEEQKVVQVDYVPRADYECLLQRVNALESKQVVVSPPSAPLPPAYVPNQVDIDSLIRNCRS